MEAGCRGCKTVSAEADKGKKTEQRLMVLKEEHCRCLDSGGEHEKTNPT